jgi:hypothetical protein
MKQKTFAVKSGEEMLCSEYLDELPRYVDLSVASHCVSKRPIWLGDAADP